MITEDQIASTIEALETVDYEQVVVNFQNAQPVVASYLINEQSSGLVADERELLLYLGVVIWQTVQKHQTNISQPTVDDLAEAEEANWAILESQKGGAFQERLTPFFENTDQEDLLALVEDFLADDPEEDGEDLQITEAGREPIFVTLKTVIDCWTAEN